MLVNNRAFFEIGPLFEEHWTGIPTVTFQIAKRALVDDSIEWGFLYENIKVDRDTLTRMMLRQSGSGFLPALERAVWDGNILLQQEAKAACGIFPSIKPLRETFAREATIIHDLSTLLTPQFHHIDTINHHANRYLGDAITSEKLFCVSSATANDVKTYLGTPAAQVEVLPLGIDIDPCLLSELVERKKSLRIDPYVCVLGTIEPRKNGQIVLEYLKHDTSFLDRFTLVFIGRDGWLDAKRNMLEQLERQGADTDRIIFSGYVSEWQKLSLLFFSQFCIYPSYFEGYGLPVAEAACLGKFVVCSDTSSMPEVYPERSFFFDPQDVFSFARAMSKAEEATAVSALDRQAFSEILATVEKHSWDRTYQAICRWILQ